jgi:flagellar basal body-associated protein FliL
MTEEKKTKNDAPADGKKGGPSPLALLLPALLAGAAAFGGAKFSAAHAAAAGGAPAVAEHVAAAIPPPGPTVPLEPFLVLTQDVNKKSHPMKVTLAIEFNETAKEETLKSFTPRIRDAALSYLRLIPYEDALDSTKTEKFRADILDRVRASGATAAERILITDLVVQ